MALRSCKSSETRNLSLDDNDKDDQSSRSTTIDSHYEASIERRVRPYVDTMETTGQPLSASIALPAEENSMTMTAASNHCSSNAASANTAQHVLEERLQNVAPDVLRRMYLDEHAEYLTVLDEILLLQSELDDCEDRLGAALDKHEAAQKEVEQLQVQLATAEEQVGVLLYEKAETLAKLADAKSELAELSARRVTAQTEHTPQTTPISQASSTASSLQAAQSARSQRWAMERLQASHDELKARVGQLEGALALQRTRNAQLASAESGLLAEVSRLAQQLREAEARQRAARSTPRTSLARLTNTPSPRTPAEKRDNIVTATRRTDHKEEEVEERVERVDGVVHNATAMPVELQHSTRTTHVSTIPTQSENTVLVGASSSPFGSRTLVKTLCTTSSNTEGGTSKEGLSEEVLHEVVTEEPTATTTTVVASSTQIDGTEPGWLSGSPTSRSLEQRGMERVLRIASSVRRRQAAMHELCQEERATLQS